MQKKSIFYLIKMSFKLCSWIVNRLGRPAMTPGVFHQLPSKSMQTGESGASEKGLVKVSILYPFAERKTYNMEYYENQAYSDGSGISKFRPRKIYY